VYKHEIVNRLMNEKIVAILRKIDGDKFDGVLQAIIKGGIKCVEVTLNSQGALDLINRIHSKYGEEICVGAGTVLDQVSCRLAIMSDAQYIVTPTLNEEVIRMANMYGKPCIPGAATPTEILKAYESGAEIIKVFPAASLGSAFFKDIKGPLPHIPLMATGGVSLDNIIEFSKAGACTFGIGSSLTDREAIKNGDFNKIEELAKGFVNAVKK
jgi:2-dehydro-3-deoxyphosphogluconate aldolase / (4S)-4-hydroxy-2-oxoglutarate aldolase